MRFRTASGIGSVLPAALTPLVSVTRFKDLADKIGAGDPDTKLLLPSVGPVKTNLCEWFENKYTLYF